MSQADAARRVTFRDVLANREFRAIYTAQTLSVIGDQLAKIAIALLVFARTGSATLTAATYAATFLPWLIGGPWLSVYADQMPRRRVMVLCDVARALVVLILAVPGVPVPVALAVVGFVSLLQPPFNAARQASVPDVLSDPDEVSIGMSLGLTTNQLGQVFGFAAGGVMVGALSAPGTIVVDSLTFALSAALIGARVKSRMPDVSERPGRQGARAEAVRFVRGNRLIVKRVAMAYLVVAATIGPESVAVPYAAAHHRGPMTAGLLTAAIPLGTMLGALWLSRVAGQVRAERLLPALALLTTGLLGLTALDPAPVGAAVLWTVAGASSAMIITLSSYLARVTPTYMRGRVFGLLGAGLAVTQGAFALLTGALTTAKGPATAIADVALPAFAALVLLIVMYPDRSSIPGDGSTSSETGETGEERVTRRFWRPERRGQILWAASALMALASVATVQALHDSSAAVRADAPAWWFLVLFIIVQAYPLQFEFRNTQRWVLLDSVALILGLFFLTPVALIVVRVLAKFILAVVRHRPPPRLAFNVASGALHTGAAIAIFRLLFPAGASVHIAAWPAVVAAVVVDDVVSSAIVACGGYIYDRTLKVRTLWPPLAFSLTVNLVITCLGLVTAGAIVYDASNAWLITGFLVLTLTGFHTYHRLADRHAALDRLYAFAKDLGPLSMEPADLAPVLSHLRELLRAPSLELAVAREPGLTLIITASDDDDIDGVMVREQSTLGALEPVEGGGSETGSRHPRRLFRRGRPTAWSPEEMAVHVGPAEDPAGILRARTKGRGGRVFDRNDLRLLEAIADQLAAALEKGHLVTGLRDAATRDSLTGVANLDTLREVLNTMLAEESNSVLLLMDIDRFHDINDTLGHETGDTVLVEVARRLEAAATHGSFVARVGGDQFAMVIPGQSSGDIARLAALAIKSRVDGPLAISGVAADIRVTVGMARSPDHGEDATTLLRRAEIAMGSAKGGSGGISEWEPQMERDGSRRMYVLAGLRQAIADSELTVEFQPKLSLGSGDVRGFEALVRWRHPDLGLVPPSEFIPLAEASGLVGTLTTNVLRLALETCRRWHDQGREVGIAVNISARSLDDPVLVGQVAALLTASGLDSRYLTLEITESSVMENTSRSIEVLRQLRSLGVRLSIDDFGTGYSSLYYLRGLPVHEVKIDKTFVDNIDHDGADRAVVRAVVELCESLGLNTVAEGVEQASQAYALQALGVKEVQGYFYGRPMPEPDATNWLRNRRIVQDFAEGRQRG